ncbi:MAG: ABC transporter substrate-binding protein [Salinigranum sp.]
MREHRRRDVLRTLGLVATGGAACLAGCTGASSGGENGGGTSGAGATPSAATPGKGGAAGGTTSEAETAGGSKTDGSAGTLTDMAGRTVSVPPSVDRVVGLGPGALRVVAYLGATDRVVGVENLETTNEKRPYRPYVLANRGLTDLPPIGSRKSPDAERILERSPDVVFWAYANGGKADDLQSKLGVPVVVLRPGDLTPALRPNFFETLRLAGTVLDASGRAETLTEYAKNAIGDLEKRAPAGGAPAAYVGFIGRGKHGFTRTQPQYPPFEFVGADNVVANVSGDEKKKKKGAARVTVDPEQVIKWDPEYVFVDLGTESYDALSKPEYGSIAAIEEGNVFAVFPTRDYAINFGTVLADAYAIGSDLFPDAYADVDPKAKADEIYRAFVGEGVYDGLAEGYGRGFGRMNVNGG